MNMSDVILEPTEEDEEYVDSFFSWEQEIEYNLWCIENYL